jgi:A/G-specific adenine glycosylase
MWKGLLAEIMLQRTRSDQVRDAFTRFDSRYRTAADLAALTEKEVSSIFAPLGLKWRIPLFTELAGEIVRRNGRLPRTERELQRLPGVGPYAAAATLSLHTGIRAVIIDSNTVRIVSRLLGIEPGPETRRKRWVKDVLEVLTPTVGFKENNYALLDLGALVCRPRRPDCVNCPIVVNCRTGVGRTAQ